MRTPERHEAKDGTITWKVKYRSGGSYTSETFRKKSDANDFARALDAGGPLGAAEWLAARHRARDTLTYGQWLEIYVRNLTGVTPRTRADYFATSRRYLASIEALPLPLIGRHHITTIVNDMDARGLAAKTIKNTVHMTASVLAAAVEEGHIVKNPCSKINLPKNRHDREQIRFLEHHEFTAIYDATPNHYKPLVAFLIGTGLRWSEATALQGKHVSIERGTVSVRQAWKHQGAGKGWAIGPPKSDKGTRTVNAAVLALAVVEPLLRGREDFVFLTPSGVPVRHNNFYSRIWLPTMERAGYPKEERPRIKDLRHTHASWLISDGMSLEQVQDQLGHESILTTRKIYAHLLPALGVAVGASASAALARALGDRVEAGGGRLALNAVEGANEAADAHDVGADSDDAGEAGQHAGS